MFNPLEVESELLMATNVTEVPRGVVFLRIMELFRISPADKRLLDNIL